LLLLHSLALLLAPVFGNLARNLLTLFFRDLLALLPRYLGFHNVSYSGTMLLGNRYADISLHIVALFLRNSVRNWFVDGFTLLLVSHFTLLFWYRLAFLAWNTLAFFSGYILAHLLRLVMAMFLGDNFSHLILYFITLFPGNRSADGNVD